MNESELLKRPIMKHLMVDGPIKSASTKVTLSFRFSAFLVVFSICSAWKRGHGYFACCARVEEPMMIRKSNIA
jgi:hypothetical protein